jgi:hypothetical protein
MPSRKTRRMCSRAHYREGRVMFANLGVSIIVNSARERREHMMMSPVAVQGSAHLRYQHQLIGHLLTSNRRKQACRRRNASRRRREQCPRTESLGAHPHANGGRVERFKEARGDILYFDMWSFPSTNAKTFATMAVKMGRVKMGRHSGQDAVKKRLRKTCLHLLIQNLLPYGEYNIIHILRNSLWR